MKVLITETQYKNILTSKQLIAENVKQGEDLFKKIYGKEIPKENVDYVNLINLLVKNNQVGYTPLLIKLFGEDFKNATEFYVKDIIPNKDNLKLLPKQILSYNNLDELSNDLENLSLNKNIKKILNLVQKKNVDLYNTFKNDLENRVSKENIQYFVNEIYPTKFIKLFTKKIDRYVNNPKELVGYFLNVIKDHKRGFTYEKMINKIGALPPEDIEILSSENDENNSYIFVHTKTNEGLKLVGSISWCIWNDETFLEYTENNNERQQYVIVDFYADDINKSVIGFTIDENKNITHAHLRDDEDFSGQAKSYLENRKLWNKILNGHSFVKKSEKIRKIKNSPILTDEIMKRDTEDKFKSNLVKINFYEKLLKFYQILGGYRASEFDYYQSWDIKIEFFVDKLTNQLAQDFILKLYRETKDIESTKKSIVLLFKEIPYLTYNFYESIDTFKKEYKVMPMTIYVASRFVDNLFNMNVEFLPEYRKMVIDIVKELYKKGFNFDSDTKHEIERNLNKFEGKESLLNLMRIRKDKTDEPYSPLEFYHSKDKRNFKNPIIDKIQQMRRYNNNILTMAEVKYGIENGLEKTIRDIYNKLLNTYRTNQVDYETMRIYQYLGMLKELKEMISFKAKNYGVDSLNSIENSLISFK
jgi:hypothetical protein